MSDSSPVRLDVAADGVATLTLDMVSSHMAVLEDLPAHGDGIAAFRNRTRGAR